jgi:parvulin-like peptidyl-prolyl isomerase
MQQTHAFRLLQPLLKRLLVQKSILQALTVVAAACVFSPPSLALAQVSQSSALSAETPFKDNTLDGILVTVGDDPILLSDLQRAVRATSNGETTLRPDGTLVGGALTPPDVIKIRDQIIDQKVLGLRVKEMGIDVGPEELDSEITALLKQRNYTREDFEKFLAQEGETEEAYREEFRNQLETQRFIGRVIKPLVGVTPDEVRNFYLQQARTTLSSQKVNLRSLVINLPADLPESQRLAKQERINSIRKEVDSGAAFASLVKLYSESPDALKQEGLLPSRNVAELPKELQEKLGSAKPGQVVGPLALGSSVFFFEFLGFEMKDSTEFESQRPQWEGKLLDVKFQERLEEYIRAERTKVKIVERPFQIRR